MLQYSEIQLRPIEIRFRLLQLSFGLLQARRSRTALRFRLSDCGLRLVVFGNGRIRIRFGIVVIVFRDDALFGQLRVPLEDNRRVVAGDPRCLQVCFCTGQVRCLSLQFRLGTLNVSLRRGDRGLRVFQLRLKIPRIELRQELAVFNRPNCSPHIVLQPGRRPGCRLEPSRPSVPRRWR